MGRPRIRTVKPEYWTDGKIKRLSDSCALFYIALWNFCDDEGKHRLDYDELAGKTARWRKDKIKIFIKMLVESGRIRVGLWSDPSQTSLRPPSEYLQTTNWFHQLISHPHDPLVKAEQIQWFNSLHELNAASNSGNVPSVSDRMGSDLLLAKETTKSQGDKKDKEQARKKPNNQEGETLLRVWNENRGDLPEALSLGEKRNRAAAARWAERPDENYWTNIVKKMAESSLCRGEKNEPGSKHAHWRADFDFFLKPDTHTKVMEGKYDDRFSSQKKYNPIDPKDLS